MKPVQIAVKALTVLGFFVTNLAMAEDKTSTGHLLDHDVRMLGSEQVINLKEAYSDNVVLIVNTASKCAFTNQYEGLEGLYDRYKERGLVVLGFPSNDFGGQEPGTEQQIQDFCRLTYGVEFPMFAKTSVAKGNADALFTGLAEAAGRYPRWNFHKYLIDRKGRMADNFLSSTKPQSDAVIDAIEAIL